MKYYFPLLPLLAMTLGCNGLTNKNDSLKNSEIQFEKNWKAFEKHHVGGVVNKDTFTVIRVKSYSLIGVFIDFLNL